MVLWLAANSIIMFVIAVVVYLTVRQFGVVLNYVGPVGARQMTTGPRIGENVSTILPNEGDSLQLPGVPAVLVFVSRSCAICEVVREACFELAAAWRGTVHIVLAYDEQVVSTGTIARERERWIRVVETPLLRKKLDVHMVPYGVALDGDGNVVGKGLVNNIGHVESLLELLSVPAVEFQRVASEPKVTHEVEA